MPEQQAKHTLDTNARHHKAEVSFHTSALIRIDQTGPASFYGGFHPFILSFGHFRGGQFPFQRGKIPGMTERIFYLPKPVSPKSIRHRHEHFAPCFNGSIKEPVAIVYVNP
jgi:hypothetical protein